MGDVGFKENAAVALLRAVGLALTEMMLPWLAAPPAVAADVAALVRCAVPVVLYSDGKPMA